MLISLTCFGLITSLVNCFPNEPNYFLNDTIKLCPDVYLHNAVVKVEGEIGQINCNEGYDLQGSPNIFCLNGRWDLSSDVQCNKKCLPPPFVKNGAREITGLIDQKGYYSTGALAKYICNSGYHLTPVESKYRVCEEGIWMGQNATCPPIKKVVECKRPKGILNGYYVVPKGSMGSSNFYVGDRLLYDCNPDFVLLGAPVQQCLESGHWSPKTQPTCTKGPGVEEEMDDSSCRAAPIVPFSSMSIIHGIKTDDYASHGTVIELSCYTKYVNTIQPCQPSQLTCEDGQWIGLPPVCVPAHECTSPPFLQFGTMYRLPPAVEQKNKIGNDYFPIQSKVSYECFAGYVLEGREVLTCSNGGCWLPSEPPICRRIGTSFYTEDSEDNHLLVAMSFGAGVFSLLIIICLGVICGRKRQLSRAVPLRGPLQQRSDLGDHATLLRHPDRLAIIAFADMQGEGPLPSYDEATRAPNLTVTRVHRPAHWSNLGNLRRSRNSPNPDIARNGSFVSHTPSIRSTGDSMGSTDTMAISEGSTNLLDNGSSHSGASCRANCGSLASFDTTAMNNEGVPLLEENLAELNEQDEGQESISMMMENHSLSDGGSHKFSTTSTDLY